MDDFSKMYERLSTAVAKMKNNREKVPVEVLETKYQKSYEALKREIKEAGSYVFNNLVIMNVRIKPGDTTESWIKPMTDVYSEADENGLPTKLGDALTKYCDLDLFVLYAMQMQYAFERRCYMDYWLSHTHVLGGAYYNDIVDMWYNQKTKSWMNANKEFGLFWPPTRELYLERLAKDEAEVAEEIAKRTEPEKIIVCA